MKKQLIAIALALSFTPVVLPQNSRAQTGVWEIPCVASGACAVIATYVVAGITYYTLKNRRTGKTWDIDGRNLQNHRQPIVQPGPRPEFRQQGESFYNPATQEFTLANNRDGCREKEKRVKKAHPEWDVWLQDVKRNRSPGTFNEALCIWQGRDRKLLKRYYNS